MTHVFKGEIDREWRLLIGAVMTARRVMVATRIDGHYAKISKAEIRRVFATYRDAADDENKTARAPKWITDERNDLWIG